MTTPPNAPVIHVPCRICGKPRDVLGVARCYACLTPAERARFGQQRAT